MHYHIGLKAGENTLESHLARLLTRTINSENGNFSDESFRNAYINFMKTPGSHNDVYAPKAHRHFFKSLAFDNLAPIDCRSDDPGAVDGIDALTVTIPIIIRYSEADRDIRN